MNQTGIIRKIDELGRIVLPKELRKYLNINSGDDFQILLDDNKIILEKYSYLKNYEKEILKIINSFSIVNEYDINLIINNEIINRNNVTITENFINIINTRKMYYKNENSKYLISKDIYLEGKIVILPLVINSDLLGALLIVSKDDINNIINTAKIIYNIIKNYFV